MSYYRAYIIGRDGHFQQAVELDSTDDDAAIESAKQLVNGYDVELWQQHRLVAKLRVRSRAGTPPSAGPWSSPPRAI